MSATSPAAGRQEIPARLKAHPAFSDLTTLIDHRICVDVTASVDAVYDSFRDHGQEYIGVVVDGRLLGAVSHPKIGLLLSGRFGHALFARKPVGDHLLENFIFVTTDTPLLEVLHRVFSREGEPFHYDVGLVDIDGRYLGMIAVQTLVRVQSALVRQQLRALEEQRRTLEERSSALFRSSHQLRQSEGRFGILFENSALGVALLNPQGDLELANQRLRALLGPAIPELNLLRLLTPEDRSRFSELLVHHDDAQHADMRTTAEFTLDLPARGRRIFRFFTHWISETGQICALIDDVTEQRIMERRLAQQEKSALLDSLVGGIAHELNNKLMPVMGYSELLINEARQLPEMSDFAQSCGIIHQSAAEAAGIVKQLLQLSRPGALKPESFDLRAVIDDAIPVLRFRLRDVGCQTRITLPDFPVRISGAASQLKQVLVNMALNAIDAMEGKPAGLLAIELRIENGDAVLFISDTGRGISPEHQSRIFDPFFTTKGPQRGTGLGLSVCFSIIRQHRGEITLDQTGPEGTKFRIAMPLDITESKAVPPRRKDPAMTRLPEGEELRLRVLVVDDEEFITQLVQESIRRELQGRATQVQTGEQAIERLKADDFDLIISDVRMPGVDGFGLLEWIQTHRPELAMRFFFMTGDAGSLGLNERLENIGVPVLRKPFTIQSLLQQCRKIVGDTRRRLVCQA